MGNNIDLNLPGASQFANVSSWTATRLIGAAVNLILIIAGLVLFFFLLLGGFQYMVAAGGGDKQGSQRAQRAISGALIGLLIVFGAYAILVLAGNVMGVNLLLFNIISV